MEPMNVEEIHEAIDTNDMNRVWELMFQRTAWIQNNTFTPEEAQRHASDTLAIRERLIQFQEESKEQITQILKRRHASRAYGNWREQE